MPRSIAEKRKEFMTTLLGVMNRLDPTGANASIYEEKFDKMNDDEFVKWITDFKNDEKQNLYLETIDSCRIVAEIVTVRSIRVALGNQVLQIVPSENHAVISQFMCTHRLV